MDRIDPLSDKFPSQSPYVTSGNSPIMMVDVEGREMAHAIYWNTMANLDGDPNLSDAEIRISNEGFVAAVATTTTAIGVYYVGAEAVAVYGTGTVVTTIAAEVLDESAEAVVARVLPGWELIPLSLSDGVEYLGKKASKKLLIEATTDVTGTVAKKVVPDAATGTVAKVHGNSKSSQKLQHGYQVIDTQTGNILEFGISGQKLNLDGTSPRIKQKLRTKYRNDPNVEGQVIITDMPNRQVGLDWEQGKVNEFSKTNNGRGPKNQKRPLPERE